MFKNTLSQLTNPAIPDVFLHKCRLARTQSLKSFILQGYIKSKTVGRSTILSWGPKWEWVCLWSTVEEMPN